MLSGRALLRWVVQATTACAATALAAPIAVANPFELFGANTRSSALGQSMAARNNDWTGLWHNPASMAGMAPHMAVGTLFAFDDVQVAVKPRPAGYDLPDLGASSPQIPSNARLQPRQGSTDITNVSDFVIGAVGNFGLRDLRIGVAAALPMTRLGLQHSHFADEREQYASNRLSFELLGSRVQSQVILLGLAYPILPRLAVGCAMSVLPKGHAVSDVYLDDPARQQDVRIVVQNEQLGRIAPSFGANWKPTDTLQIGASWRAANHFDLTIENRIQIKGFQGDKAAFPIRQRVDFVLNYTPEQVDIGVAQTWGPLAVAVDAVWSRWSGYIDSQGEHPTDWKNVWSVRAGAEYTAQPDRVVRAGLQWEPSPVPSQAGRSNYVDTDRAVVSVGAGHKLDLLGKRVELGWFVAGHALLTTDTNKAVTASTPCAPGVTAVCDEVNDNAKDGNGKPIAAAAGLQTGNPGFPGFVAWGNLLVVGADLKWEF